MYCNKQLISHSVDHASWCTCVIRTNKMHFSFSIYFNNLSLCWSQWPLGLRRRSTAARLLWSWVRIPPGAWMSVVSVACCQLITRPEESNRLWCVVVCDLEKQTSWMRRPRPTRRLSRQEKKKIYEYPLCTLNRVTIHRQEAVTVYAAYSTYIYRASALTSC